MMVSEKEFNDVDLRVKQNNLYLEESFNELYNTPHPPRTPVKPHRFER
jgi:hypothetical protein